MRVMMTARRTGTAAAAASVIIERLWAALGLIVLSLVGFFSFQQAMGRVAVLIPVLAGVIIGLTGLLLYPGWGRFILRFCARYPKVVTGLSRFLEVLEHYRSRPWMLLRLLGWSVIFQGIIVVINYFLFRGMGVPVSWSLCLRLVPLISALSMVPLSINGLGVREWSYVALFTPWGIEAPAGLAVSLSFYLVVLLVSLLGGMLYVLESANK